MGVQGFGLSQLKSRYILYVLGYNDDWLGLESVLFFYDRKSACAHLVIFGK